MDDLESLGVFDAIIAIVQNDRDDAEHFIEQLQSNVVVGGQIPTVKILSDIQFGDKYDSLEKAMEGSTLLFIFVSRNYCKECTKFDTLIKHEFIESTLIDEEKKDCLVPLWADEGLKKPFHLHIWSGYTYSRDDDKKNRLLWKNLGNKWNTEPMRRRRSQKIELKGMELLAKRERDIARHNIVKEKLSREQDRKKALIEDEHRWELPEERSSLVGEDCRRCVPVHGHSVCKSLPLNLTVNVNISKDEPQQEDEMFGRHRPPKPSTAEESLSCIGEKTEPSLRLRRAGEARSVDTGNLPADQNTDVTATTGSETEPSEDGNDILQSHVRSGEGGTRTGSGGSIMEPGRTLRSKVTDQGSRSVSVPTQIPAPVQALSSGVYNSASIEKFKLSAPDSTSLSLRNAMYSNTTNNEDTETSKYASEMDLPSAMDVNESWTREDYSSPQPLTLNPRYSDKS